jgi:hypothetical protein
MTIPPTQINYPQTTFNLVSANGTQTTLIDWAGVTTTNITPAKIIDYTNMSGNANQVLSAGSGGTILWVDLPLTPSLADVMAVSPAGDASGQALSNIPSITMNNGANSSVVLSANASSDLLSISTNPDITGATKEFSRKYLPLNIAGTTYYIQLYSVPSS